MQPLLSGERQAHSSLPEDRFVELFVQVFGLDKMQLPGHECPSILRLERTPANGYNRGVVADFARTASHDTGV